MYMTTTSQWKISGVYDGGRGGSGEEGVDGIKTTHRVSQYQRENHRDVTRAYTHAGHMWLLGEGSDYDICECQENALYIGLRSVSKLKI